MSLSDRVCNANGARSRKLPARFAADPAVIEPISQEASLPGCDGRLPRVAMATSGAPRDRPFRSGSSITALVGAKRRRQDTLLGAISGKIHFRAEAVNDPLR